MRECANVCMCVCGQEYYHQWSEREREKVDKTKQSGWEVGEGGKGVKELSSTAQHTALHDVRPGLVPRVQFTVGTTGPAYGSVQGPTC